MGVAVAGGRSRAFQRAAVFLLILAPAAARVTAAPLLEQWNADVSLRLRTLYGGTPGDVDSARAGALLRLDSHFRLFVAGRFYDGTTTLPEYFLRYANGSQQW